MANTGKYNPGNFANNRDKASEAGKKGSQASGGNQSSDKERMSGGGQGGRGGNCADDPQKSSEAGKRWRAQWRRWSQILMLHEPLKPRLPVGA
ncbi:con-10 family general stress protein [Pseudomonas sp. RT4P38]